MKYGGNADVARCAALLALYDLMVEKSVEANPSTGETIYILRDADGNRWTTTARELAFTAKQTMKWFEYPYGDQGDKEERDEQGKVIRERREGHPGYVHPNQQDWRDAMVLQEETVEVAGVTFALPQGACSNITWHQYRSLQAIAPQLWQDGLTDEEARSLHAQFLAYILVPAPPTADTGDRFHTKPSFRYDAERAEASVQFWENQLRGEEHQPIPADAPTRSLSAISQFPLTRLPVAFQPSLLFHICFQVWQTAVVNFYPSVFPLLFGGGKSDPLHTALTGETDTINAVMKYQGYSSPEQVYNTELPIILGTLNTMSKEAKEIEKMNAKIKRKG